MPLNSYINGLKQNPNLKGKVIKSEIEKYHIQSTENYKQAENFQFDLLNAQKSICQFKHDSLLVTTGPIEKEKYYIEVTLFDKLRKNNKRFTLNANFKDLNKLDNFNLIPQKTPYFNQDDVVIPKVQRREFEFPRLNEAIMQHGGLCEILCNHIVMQDILKPENENQIANFDKTVVLNKLEADVAPLHILKQVSIFQLIKAVLFNKIPNNYLSTKDQQGLNNVVAKDRGKVEGLMSKAIDNIKPGEYAKYFAYDKKGFNFSGHSMLIRKNTDSTYTFFDPNGGKEGVRKFANKEDLIKHVLNTAKNLNDPPCGYKHMCFMNVQKMLPKPTNRQSNKLSL